MPRNRPFLYAVCLTVALAWGCAVRPVEGPPEPTAACLSGADLTTVSPDVQLTPYVWDQFADCQPAEGVEADGRSWCCPVVP